MVTQPAGAESGVSFATQPVIEVRDGANTRVNTAELVTATITSGAGTLAGTTTVAANHGVAQFTNLVIAGSGAFVITFTSPASSSGSSVSFTVTQVVRQLVITTQPGGAVSGANLAPQPAVSLRDQAGLVVSTATNAVTATVASGPGVLGGTSTVNAVGGVASFATLKITGAGAHTLTFGSAGAPSATSASFAIVAAAATQLVVVTQPAAATESGVAFPTQPVVEIQDATNTKVAGATNVVTATLASGSGTLSGTTWTVRRPSR